VLVHVAFFWNVVKRVVVSSTYEPQTIVDKLLLGLLARHKPLKRGTDHDQWYLMSKIQNKALCIFFLITEFKCESFPVILKAEA